MHFLNSFLRLRNASVIHVPTMYVYVRNTMSVILHNTRSMLSNVYITTSVWAYVISFFVFKWKWNNWWYWMIFIWNDVNWTHRNLIFLQLLARKEKIFLSEQRLSSSDKCLVVSRGLGANEANTRILRPGLFLLELYGYRFLSPAWRKSKRGLGRKVGTKL